MQRLTSSLILLPRWQAVPDAKRLIFIRHAEGWHNKDYNEIPNYMSDGLGETEKYWDALLTPHGISQSQELARKLADDADAEKVRLVVTSPLSRAIQTATIAFNVGGPHPPFVATSLARERVWNHQCDRRRERHQLELEFPHVDFPDLATGPDEMWPHKEIEPSPFNSTAVAVRARLLLQWLWARPESTIAVCSHWVFLSTLFALPELGDTLAAELGTNFSNAEARHATLVRAPLPTGHDDEKVQVTKEEL